MSVIQRITFPVSSAYTSRPNSFASSHAILNRASGHVSSFHGLQVDDGKTGYFITVWQSPQDHHAFSESAVYGDFLSTLKPAAAGELETYHITLGSIDPSTALGSPTTELVLFTLKEGITIADVAPLFEELARGLDAASGAHPPCFWGPSDDNHILVFVGWDSVEAHWEAVKEGTVLHVTIQALLKKTDFVLGHAPLVKCTI
ncbi:hypothetical protein MVEN_00601200 [Mycena venus]|uniref:ABM domain-containing protein n=1 Tax=Mycena venus TaxID=2733690 RepID=A0A8H7D7Q9_9AGAR|nr:hypothetical protein MVEN_00601200 [Mycena venus]